ncbi:MAG: hypothetical protein C4530_19925 [Desulfobacteraceae bacterium]|nr:MAG: hypothetical protein C4530_19925 [Desulfobacteraceae bacterium]
MHISAKVERRLKDLEKSGKEGYGLARRTHIILDSLAAGEIRHPVNAVGSQTKYGEKRIKKCRKYDLGCGYRLITLQRGLKIFIPFLGTHDECERWLEKNSRLKEIAAGKGKVFRIPDDSQPQQSPANTDSADIEEDSDDEPTLKLSDRQLRRVFCGLVEAGRKRAS